MSKISAEAVEAAARAIDPAAWAAEANAAEIGTRYAIEHDGFVGDVRGHYTRRDGYRGVVLQQDGTNVVHVYGRKWLKPLTPGAS